MRNTLSYLGICMLLFMACAGDTATGVMIRFSSRLQSYPNHRIFAVVTSIDGDTVELDTKTYFSDPDSITVYKNHSLDDRIGDYLVSSVLFVSDSLDTHAIPIDTALLKEGCVLEYELSIGHYRRAYMVLTKEFSLGSDQIYLWYQYCAAW